MEKINIEYLWQDRKRVLFFGLPWSFTKYGLTKDRLIIKKGFFTLTTDEVRLYRILDISLKQTLMQRMFGLGTISITSNDKSLGNFELKNIKNSESAKELLSQKIEEERINKRVSSREFISDIDDCDCDEEIE